MRVVEHITVVTGSLLIGIVVGIFLPVSLVGAIWWTALEVALMLVGQLAIVRLLKSGYFYAAMTAVVGFTLAPTAIIFEEYGLLAFVSVTALALFLLSGGAQLLLMLYQDSQDLTKRS